MTVLTISFIVFSIMFMGLVHGAPLAWKLLRFLAKEPIIWAIAVPLWFFISLLALVAIFQWAGKC